MNTVSKFPPQKQIKLFRAHIRKFLVNQHPKKKKSSTTTNWTQSSKISVDIDRKYHPHRNVSKHTKPQAQTHLPRWKKKPFRACAMRDELELISAEIKFSQFFPPPGIGTPNKLPAHFVTAARIPGGSAKLFTIPRFPWGGGCGIRHHCSNRVGHRGTVKFFEEKYSKTNLAIFVRSEELIFLQKIIRTIKNRFNLFFFYHSVWCLGVWNLEGMLSVLSKTTFV